MIVAKRPKLRMRWYGRTPKVGEYLRSIGSRARTAYRIVAAKWKWSEREQLWVGPVTVERSPIAAIPKGARVHRFVWNSRSSRKRRGRAPII